MSPDVGKAKEACATSLLHSHEPVWSSSALRERPAESHRPQARTPSAALVSLGEDKWPSYGRLTWPTGFGFPNLALVR